MTAQELYKAKDGFWKERPFLLDGYTAQGDLLYDGACYSQIELIGKEKGFGFSVRHKHQPDGIFLNITRSQDKCIFQPRDEEIPPFFVIPR